MTTAEQRRDELNGILTALIDDVNITCELLMYPAKRVRQIQKIVKAAQDELNNLDKN